MGLIIENYDNIRYKLATDSQDVEAVMIRANIKDLKGCNSLIYSKNDDGSICEVVGFEGIIPALDKSVVKLKECWE